MAISIKFHAPGLSRLLSRTKFSAADVSEAARTGFAAASGKASDTIACARLRRTVEELEDEIALQMCNLGEIVYATHCGRPSDSGEMQKILEYVDRLHEEIEGHERERKRLRGISFCPVCGAENAPANTYCRDCGQPLSAVSSDKV